jgi:DNA polymerase III alpha subunit
MDALLGLVDQDSDSSSDASLVIEAQERPRVLPTQTVLPVSQMARPVTHVPVTVVQKRPLQLEDEEREHEKYSGFCIRNRLVSSALMDERMQGRVAVRVREMASHMRGGKITKNWVLLGVFCDKSSPRTSSRGNKFLIAKLSDLAGESVNLFLFDDAFHKYRMTSQGSIFAVLNPEILKPTEVSKIVSVIVQQRWHRVKQVNLLYLYPIQTKF